jgi:hypothetical protein
MYVLLRCRLIGACVSRVSSSDVGHNQVLRPHRSFYSCGRANDGNIVVAGRLPMTAGVNALPSDTKVARVMGAMRAGIGARGGIEPLSKLL